MSTTLIRLSCLIASAALPALVIVLSACATKPPATRESVVMKPFSTVNIPRSPAQAEEVANQLATHLLDATLMDLSVNPCDDFYSFACGGWQQRTLIPPFTARWDHSFSVLEFDAMEKVRGILADFVSGQRAVTNDDARKLSWIYKTCLAATEPSRNSLAELQPALNKISDLKSLDDLPGVMAYLRGMGVDTFVSTGLSHDVKSSDLTALWEMDQGGITLPSREYYLDDTKAELRTKYHDLLTEMFVILGDGGNAGAQADQTIAIETALAKISEPRANLLDPSKNYNKLTLGDFANLAPQLNWSQYFKGIGYTQNSILVTPASYFPRLGAYLPTLSLEAVKAYLKSRLALAYDDAISPESIALEQKFSLALTGQAKSMDRDLHCMEQTGSIMADAISREYVHDFFPPASKVAAQKMIVSIEAAFKKQLETAAWLDDATRAQALVKFAKLGNKVGYPDQWRDYSDLQIQDHSYLGNLVANQAFEMRDDMKHAGHPMDRSHWGIPAHEVNAFYNAATNEIVVLAGILRPPFFDPKADASRNYGAMGMVIGHELTHGYDSIGRMYNGNGNLNNWWSASANQNFNDRAQCLQDEYSTFPIAGGGHVNGKTTLTENIADNGGLRVAYAAFESQKSSADFEKSGWTPEQRFFITNAQMWFAKSTDQMEQLLNAVDSHSPGRYRVIGVESNMTDFAKAFQCASSGKMVRAPSCAVW